jgi:hypothetical protein
MAFEVTEIVDYGVARGNNDMINLERLLRKAYSSLPESDQDQLKPILENAQVVVSFKLSASLRSRVAVIPAIIIRLPQLTTTTETELILTSDLPVTIQWVRVLRRNIGGPNFFVAAGSSFADPIVDRIREKFRRSYESSSPVELLAFYEQQGPSPPAFWQRELNDFVAGNLDASPFRRVWIYDVLQQEILFVYP